MNCLANKSDLSPRQTTLLELMQEINFGRIEGLHVRRGEPVLSAGEKVFYDLKIGGDNAQRPELATTDFALRRGVVEFFDHLTRLQDGVLELVEVKHGLPFRLVVERNTATARRRSCGWHTCCTHLPARHRSISSERRINGNTEL
jgi:hypothetical protein